LFTVEGTTVVFAGASPRNRLLAVLEPLLEPVELVLQQVLYAPDQPSSHAYFPLSGIVSLLTVLEEGQAVEIALVGNEGVAGLTLFFAGGQDTTRAQMQSAGTSVRLAVEDCRALMQRDSALRAVLGRYSQLVLLQVGQAAACNLTHVLEQRCARWLLEMADRVAVTTFPLTHLFLAEMLGVRRASVMLAAGALQQRGLITYHRGQLTLLDRAGLAARACPCYSVVSRAVTQFLEG
jgi:CRP-like cAMP-binding protein